MRRNACLIILLLAAQVFCALNVKAQDQVAISSSGISVLRITPTGEEVPDSREIVIQFSKAVAAVGRMERKADEIDVKIEPNPGCQWRFLNTTTLSCQLGEKTALQPSTRYKLSIGADFTGLNGEKLGAAVQHEFVTQRPKIEYSWFEKWRSPGMPLIYVVFNQRVKPDSVASHLYLKSEDGKRHRLKVEAIENTGPDRWRVYPQDELPLDSGIELIVEPGIVPEIGNEASSESETEVSFASYPEFKFLGLDCWPIPKAQGKKVTVSDEGEYEGDYEGEESFDGGAGQGSDGPYFIPAGEFSADKRCNPMRSIALAFSSPVQKEDLKDHLQFTPDLAGGRKDYDPWEDVYSYVSYYYPHKKGDRYHLQLPLPLKADDVYHLKVDTGKLIDAYGRKLESSIDFKFATDHRPSKYFFGHQVSVLEKDVDSHLPVAVTNLESLKLDYEMLTTAGLQSGRSSSFELYDARNIAYWYPIKVRDLLAGKSGLIQGHLTGGSKTFDGSSWLYSQVTPYHVHVKAGHFNSLAWVTNFSDGLPVPGARVHFYEGSFNSLTSHKSLGKSALTDKDGVAMLPGLAEIDPKLGLINQWDRSQPHIFARVDAGQDLAVLPLSYNFSVYSGIYPSLNKKYGHIHAWGTTAQGVYRLGDTIQYKIFVRNQDIRKFISAPKGEYELKLVDPSGKTVFERKKINLSTFGGFDGEIQVSESWFVGWYQFVLTSSFSGETWQPLTVLISDFTPSPFKVETEVKGKSFKPGDKLSVTSVAKLHSGGPYADAAARVTGLLSSSELSFDNPLTESFEFSGGKSIQQFQMFQIEKTLDAKGELESDFTIQEVPEVVFGKLFVESAVRDDRGRYVASNQTVDYFGSERFVGLSHKGWLIEAEKPALIEAIVVDKAGTLEPGIGFSIKLEYEATKASKVKGAGNAYLTEYTYEWQEVGSCSVKSETKPVTCQLTPEKAGYYRFTASVNDGDGKTHTSTIYRYASGRGFVLWSSDVGNTLPIVPEKKEYRIGDVAKYFVQNPFPGAKALVSIERYGVLKSWPLTLAGSAEVIEVPITEDLIPGFYLSVVVMSPRVEKPIENNVDLGKPSFKIGYAETAVNDPLKELKIEVTPEREVYKPRDTVKVDLHAKAAAGTREPIEFAVAVLDESVFDLILAGASYFDPYKGFYGLDGLDLKNFNILKQLVGRQKFEKKGANPGGGGGSEQELRSVFKFVSYWNPALAADANGRASISFELPDNLTGWRVLAMAVTKTDKMGLGQGNFKANRPTEIRPALPNQVMEGDTFDAKFVVMNRTDSTRILTVELKSTGAVKEAGAISRTVEVEPFKRKHVSIPVSAIKDGEIAFLATAADALDRDAFQVKLKVLKAKALESAATYGSTVDESVSEPLAFPEDIRTDVGTVGVVTSPSVIGGIDKSFDFMRDYPYSCWEQRLSKAVMASNYIALKAYLPKTALWDGAHELVRDTIKDLESFQAPNGGMCYYIARDDYASPYLSAYTALAMSWLKERGETVPAEVENKLHEYLLNILRKDAVPDFYTKGMASSVRAVILAALAPAKKITEQDILRYFPHVEEMDLFGRAHFLRAASYFPQTSDLQRKVTDMILSFSNETGGKLIFTEALDSGYQRMLHSVPRTSCSIVSALLMARKNSTSKLTDDLFFKMIRPITEYRKGKGHWESTQENVFCLNSFVDYSSQFESVKPSLSFEAFVADASLGSGKFTSYRDEALQLERDINESDPGQKTELKINRKGKGRLYYSARMSYSPKTLKSDPINAGMELRREYSVEREGKWELLKSPYKIKVGELVRVDLYLSIPAARNFVVVDDPVPGGLEPVNRDLATASVVDANKGDFKRAFDSFWFRHDDWVQFGIGLWSFYHRELKHDAVRFYSEFLQPGNYSLSYTAQAISPGTFSILPSHSEEMYDPDVFGQGVPEVLQVSEN